MLCLVIMRSKPMIETIHGGGSSLIDEVIKKLTSGRDVMEIKMLTMCGLRSFIYYFANSRITQEDFSISDLFDLSDNAKVMLSGATCYEDIQNIFDICNDGAKQQVELPTDLKDSVQLYMTQSEYLDNILLKGLKSKLIQSAVYLNILKNIRLNKQLPSIVAELMKHLAGSSAGNPVTLGFNAVRSGAVGLKTIQNLLKISPSDVAFPLYIAKQILFIMVDYMYTKRPEAVILCASINHDECEALDSLLAVQFNNVYKAPIRISVLIKALLPLFLTNLDQNKVKGIIDTIMSGGSNAIKGVAKGAVNNMKQEVINTAQTDILGVPDKVREVLVRTLGNVNNLELITELIKVMLTPKEIDTANLSIAFNEDGKTKFMDLYTRQITDYD